MAGCSQVGQTERITLGEVLRAALPRWSETHRLPTHHWKVLRAIAACHTPALGGHHYRCSFCGQEHFVPNSCGNRHCPSCQKLQSVEWLERQLDLLLPIPYFHVVFTLPHSLNALIQANQALLYKLLFTSASATLLEFGRNNLKATLGITAVLHTWSQTLLDHYHLHGIVTGGGLALDGHSWVDGDPKWLFPVRALSVVFRARFREGLQQLFEEGKLQFPSSSPPLSEPATFARWLHQVCRPQWVVYTKAPFADTKAILCYLCRYTHRVAISNSRIEALDLEKGLVTFSYKDYAHQSQIRSMTLGLEEFVRRFCLHILPPHFVKIRHYGLLSNRDRSARLAHARSLLLEGIPTAILEAFPEKPDLWFLTPPPLVCPSCGRATLVLIQTVPRPKTLPRFDSS